MKGYGLVRWLTYGQGKQCIPVYLYLASNNKMGPGFYYPAFFGKTALLAWFKQQNFLLEIRIYNIIL